MPENPWSTGGAEEHIGEDTELPDFLKLSPEEEADLLKSYNEKKAAANSLYASSHFSEAISGYDSALESCPTYFDYEIAVLKSNVAACHIRLEEWKQAIEAANAALDGLERIMPTSKRKKPGRNGSKEKESEKKEEGGGEGSTVVELEGSGDEEEELEKLKLSDERKTQVASLRGKVLLRRARANAEQGGWGNLVTAEEDYKELSQMPQLSNADKKAVRQQLAALPFRINAAKEKEMGEMMSKLKDLGNGILKPFGLSTDMFKFQKDEATGGYNMSLGGESSK